MRITQHPIGLLFLLALVACGPPIPSSTDGGGSGRNQDAGASQDAGPPPANCRDGDHNGNESDVDCGGDCAPCNDDQACRTANDCQSQSCVEGLCAEATCDDGVQNGDEMATDCGGSCPVRCVAGDACEQANDCQSGVCNEGRCLAPSCDDGVTNGDETATDCGGACLTACAAGLACREASDCQSGVCNEQLCQEARCDDDVQNGEERAVDCGATCPTGCASGTPCGEAADCVSGQCDDGRCTQDPVEACLNGPHAADDPHRAEACAMLGYINQDRATYTDESGNAVPTRWDPNLYRVARAHSEDMCRRAFFAHQNPDGRGPSDRARAMGFDVPVAENIAVNQHPAATMHAFMAEPTCTGHRGNILDPRNTRVGIGVHRCNNPNFRWNGYMIYTQNFHMDFSINEAPYCLDPATACELPANPVSTATRDCPQQLRQWGWCDYDPADIMAPRWNCPND